jgi:integrase
MKKLRSVSLKGITYYPVDVPAGFDGNAKRSKRYCHSKNEVYTLRSRIQQWKLAKRHKPDTIELSDSDKRWIQYLHAELGTDLSPLPQILEHWRKTAKSITSPLTVLELCEQFIAYREGRPGSKRTLADMRHRCKHFALRFGEVKAHEVTPAQVRSFLDSAESPSSSRNHYKVLSVAFRWAKEHRIIVINPLDEIKRPEAEHTEPGIYKPDEFRRLLKAADKHFAEILPFVAVSGFAGIRAAELIAMYAGEETLQWSDILWDKKLIQVRPEVAKTTKRKSGDRRYVPMEPALIHWLEPHRKESGPIAPYAESWFRKLLRGLKKEPQQGDAPECFGLFRSAKVEAVDNGLRHSFASYWLARSGKEGFGSLARVMGNSEAVARRHYVEVLEPKDGKAWFGIRNS